MIRVYLFSFAFFIFLSCGEDARPLFEMEIEADFVAQAGLNNFETHFFIVRDVPTRIQSYINNNNSINPDRILANRALLTGQFRSIDFGIVQSASIWAISSVDPSIRSEIFFFEFVPFNHEGDLPLFSSLPNLKDILLEDQFDLEIRLIFKTFTPTELESRLFMSFSAYGSE